MEQNGVTWSFVDLEPTVGDFREDTIAGLSKEHKCLLPMYFYDEIGSKLFDQICELDEYYPTRTEIQLMVDIGPELSVLAGPDANVFELGSGSSTKIRNLLDALNSPASVTSIDISKDHLLKATKSLARDYPHVAVKAICADFTQPMSFPQLSNEGLKLAYFPGSTIGNFERENAVELLSNVRSSLGQNGALLIGADLIKDTGLLERAYNDKKGITAAFNKNILNRMRNDFGAKLDVSAFTHRAVYVKEKGRIEMHLISDKQQQIVIGEDRFSLEEGESIHTENSHKYTIEGFKEMAIEAGFEPVQCWTDENKLFSVHWLSAV